jgi:large subunit ribosomal protein L25
MKSITITASARSAKGKKDAKKVRDNGQVPCVLYGGKEQIHFSAPVLSFRHLVYSPEVFSVALNIDGKEYSAVMKDIQFHPVTDRIAHIDFLQTFPDKPVVIDIPVKLHGTPEGVKAGGQQVNKLRRLKVKAIPASLPDHIDLNIEALKIGDAVRVGDLKINDVEFLDSPRNIITGVRTARVVVEEVAPALVTTAAAEATPAAEGADAPKKEGDAKPGKAEGAPKK